MRSDNRFMAHAMDLSRSRGPAPRDMVRPQSWAAPLTAEQRALVVLIENGGIDLELGKLIDMIADKLPIGSDLAKSALRPLAGVLRDKIRAATDTLLESAELALNRYGAARPDQYGSVTVLRDGTATYDELKAKLIELSRAGRIVDVIILTHGGTDTISLKSDIKGDMLRAMKTEYGKPLQIRSVYMMNCKGSSLNQAWLDAGAKTVCGTVQNNYLPEPTTFFFWRNWRAGQSFQAAATNAYQATIAMMNAAINGFVGALPMGSLIGKVDVASFDFVAQSAPVVSGQGDLKVSSDDVSFTQSVSGAMATTVVPLDRLDRTGGGGLVRTSTYEYHRESYAEQMNPALAIPIADAIQIGLGAASLVKSAADESRGTFRLNYDRVERLLTNEARQEMPGSTKPAQTYGGPLFRIGMGARPVANALVAIEWTGNAYGEIGTPRIFLDLDQSSDWTHSDASLNITLKKPIPDKNVDPRLWPIVFTYTGSYDPVGNGKWEFEGEFEIDAFGGLRFNRHKVVSRAAADFLIFGSDYDYVQRGPAMDRHVTDIPPEQLAYLKKKLP